MDQSCTCSGQRPCCKSSRKGHIGIYALCDQSCGYCSPQGKASVCSQIRKIQYFICDINTQSKNTVDQSLLNDRDNKIHGLSTSIKIFVTLL